VTEHVLNDAEISRISAKFDGESVSSTMHVQAAQTPPAITPKSRCRQSGR
jgi:hypothetical protein